MPLMIAFDKVTYSPGSIVSGHVVIVRKKCSQKVKGLSMRFIGRSSRLVSESESPIRNYKKELYFDEKIDIFGHDGNDSVLEVGETLFPFTFNLPPGLPSSFVWSRGSILYFVEARLTRSSWKDDKRASCRLNVEGVYDLNLDPLAQNPISCSKSKYVQHLLNKSGPLAFSLHMNRSGFLRGHTLPFHLEIKNLSKIDAKRVRICLVQEVKQDGKQWSTVIEEIKGPSVSSGEVQSWEGRIKVPSDISPTNLGNILHFSPVVLLNYYFQVELDIKSATVEPLCGKVPVTIGTVGLVRSRDRLRFQQMQLQTQSPATPTATTSSLPPLVHHHHHHEDTCPLSRSQNATPNSLSQFSPGSLLIQSSIVVTHNNNNVNANNRSVHTPDHSCRPYTTRASPMQHYSGSPAFYAPDNHTYNGICRRLQYLQRRRRESPPPTYDEAVRSGELDHPSNNEAHSPTPSSDSGSGGAGGDHDDDDEEVTSQERRRMMMISTPTSSQEVEVEGRGSDILISPSQGNKVTAMVAAFNSISSSHNEYESVVNGKGVVRVVGVNMNMNMGEPNNHTSNVAVVIPSSVGEQQRQAIIVSSSTSNTDRGGGSDRSNSSSRESLGESETIIQIFPSSQELSASHATKKTNHNFSSESKKHIVTLQVNNESSEFQIL